MSIERDFGVQQWPGLGTAYPEIKPLIGRIFAERVARLQWVPKDWLANVTRLQEKNPGDVITLNSALLKTGAANPEAPTFADSDEKRQGWQEIFLACNEAIGNYAQGQAEDGQAELESLYARAELWDALYNIAVFVRDAPANAIGAVATGADAVAGGILKSIFSSWLVWAALIIGGAFYFVPFGKLAAKLRKK